MSKKAICITVAVVAVLVIGFVVYKKKFASENNAALA